ncbi:MAG: ferredoxin, partial [Acutalibacteraceae bacterium]|nr:ferredoxin [Acutalibacteraceae bacterium]
IHRASCERSDFSTPINSQLSQWPVQIKLVPVNAPYFDGAKLLVAADCTAFAYGNFHNEFIRNHITLIACPKLDSVDYTEKLTAIIANNNIKSVTVVRMEVPCCGGIENAVKQALQTSGKFIPWRVVTISTDGKILD